MHALTLDVAFGEDEELLDVVANLTAGTGVTSTPTGVHVAGGWPEVKFVGDAVELVTVANRYGAMTGDTNEIIARITRVV